MNLSFEDFVKHFSETEEWKELDEQRRKARKGRLLAWPIGALGLVCSLYWLLSGDPDSDAFSGLAGIVASVCIVIFMRRLAFKNYSSYYKKMFIPQLVKQVLHNAGATGKSRITYKREGCINVGKLVQTPLFHKYSNASFYSEGEDLFSGTLGETDFQFSDLTIKKPHRNWFIDHEFQFTIFRGLVFMADFHKSFTGSTTLITRKGKSFKRLSMAGSSFQTISDPFNRYFKRRTTDETTAQYLLPINILERMVELRELFARHGLSVCLHEGILVIAIHDVDFFEADGLKKPDSKAVRRTYVQIQAIVSIIELLTLNTRIWSKTNKDFVARDARS